MRIVATLIRWRGQLQQAIRKRAIPRQALMENLPRSGSVLEIGCGEGLILELLAPAMGPVVGVDFDERKISLARSRTRGRAITLTTSDAFVFLDGQASESWDNVILVDTLSSFPPAQQFALLAETLRILTPSGMLFLKTIDGNAGWKTTFSTALSFLIYKVLRLSRSQSQEFHYLAANELQSYFRRSGAGCTFLPLHRMRFHPVPHVLFLVHKNLAVQP